MRIFRYLAYLFVGYILTGCAMYNADRFTDAQLQEWAAKEVVKQDKLWQVNKAWLLARLPKAVEIAQSVIAGLDAYTGNKNVQSSENAKACYDKLIDFMRPRLSNYRLEQVPEEMGCFALIDGDAAYVFSLKRLEFSGIANLSKGLYFVPSDVPLHRTEARSFAFVANGKTDEKTVWSIYQRNILEKDQVLSPDLGLHAINSAELEAAGVARQTDRLTSQQRAELELAREGMAWLERAQVKAAQLCNSRQEIRDNQNKQGKRGNRLGKRSHDKENLATTSDFTAGLNGNMVEALESKAPLNCSTGMGYVQIGNGIAAEVSRIIKYKEANVEAIIASAAKEIPNGIMRYSYSTDPSQKNWLTGQSDQDAVLEIRNVKGTHRLILNLRRDTGVDTGSLVLPGDWYMGNSYRIAGKDLSNAEFASLFIRAYRDCAMKDDQGECKSIPELFISLLNPPTAQKYVQYITDKYLPGINADKAR